MAPKLPPGKPRGGPFPGGVPFPHPILDGHIMKDQLICGRCGLLLPPNTSKCHCGIPVEDAPSLDRARFERQFRNLYLFANAFIALGVMMILGSVLAPVDWRGIAQGLSGISGAWAFWSLVESEGKILACGRRRHLEQGAVVLALLFFLLSFVGSEFRLDLLLWLVMPASYLWRAYRVSSKDGIRTESR